MIADRHIPRWVVGLVLLATAGAVGYLAFRHSAPSRRHQVHYPYWCDHCRKVFDVEVLKQDYPKNWRIAPGGGSDSVVICPFCNKGKAYPAVRCPTCGTVYLLHIAGDGRCPKCYPANARAARAKGVDLTPPELSQ